MHLQVNERSCAAVACSSLVAIAMASMIVSRAFAAQPGATQPPQPPRAAAPVDLSGHWVALITEDWRYRMAPASVGDYASLPLNDEGRKVAEQWDPERDAREGNACKAYGVGNIMRMPTRIRVEWANDSTLRIETDAGMQTRALHFGTSPPPQQPNRTLQGISQARWSGRTLIVNTIGMSAGYLRRNGVPYSDQARITEYIDRHTDGQDSYLNITTIVEDPTYLRQPFVTNSNFKLIPAGQGWNPQPCISEWGPLKKIGVDVFGL